MAQSYVLMTSMPPTTGHLQLIQFAHSLTGCAHVIICTQPQEPLAYERVDALRCAVTRIGVSAIFTHIHKTMEQDPRADGFWDMWRKIMIDAGAGKDDCVVASESYGAPVAALIGAEFYPYDIDRVLNPAKATHVRADPLAHFSDIIPEFRRYLRTTVTVFGAESTGKTTLSRELAHELSGQWLFEYARPYLERTVNEITLRSMIAIWKGQAALQQQSELYDDAPYVIQDTDLYSTVGYWQFPHWQSAIGPYPSGLVHEAARLRSDLYIVTRSNIPFEQDPLRYGGDEREGSDAYWVALCKRYRLPYVVLDAADKAGRLAQALSCVRKVSQEKLSRIVYDRHGL